MYQYCVLGSCKTLLRLDGQRFSIALTRKTIVLLALQLYIELTVLNSAYVNGNIKLQELYYTVNQTYRTSTTFVNNLKLFNAAL